MHPNPIFRHAPHDINLAFARDRAFGTLVISAEDGLLVSHVPFLISDDGLTVELHLVRSNPIARALTAPQPAVIAVTGADGYISPDWYAAEDMVPTWNYVAVHLRGTLETQDADRLPDLLARQSAEYEGRLIDKTPWTMDKLSKDHAARMMRMIVPLRMTVEAVDGTWKLGQNREHDARIRAAGQVQSGIGQELAEIARLMTDPPA